MYWKHSHEGPGTGVRWAYLAIAVAIAIMGPGLMVVAETGGAPSGDAALETTLTTSPAEEAPSAELPAEEAAAPEVPAKDPAAEWFAGLGAATTANTARAGKPGDPEQPVGPSAVVPGTSTNLSFTFEGVRAGNGWVTGNLADYEEDMLVPYRLVITNKDSVNSVSVPLTSITLDHYVSGSNAIMFDWTQSWGYYTTPDKPAGSDSHGPAVTPLTPAEQDVPVDPPIYGTGSLIRTSFNEGYIVVPPGEYAVLWFEAHLAFTPEWMTQHDPARYGAGPIPGSSGHGQLDMTGVGAKTVPIPSVPSPRGTVTGVKFHDYDRDTVKDDGEPGLAGWTITLQGPNTTVSAITGADGSYSFEWLSAGTYHLDEVLQSDWMNSTPLPFPITIPSGVDSTVIKDIGNYRQDVMKTFRLTYSGIPAAVEPFVRYAISGGPTQDAPLGADLEVTIPVPYGAQLTTIEWRARYGAEDLLLGLSPVPELMDRNKLNTFTYAATASGSKFEDANSDTIWNGGESGLSGWTIQLRRSGALYAETLTGAGGAYSFGGLIPGTYSVTEVQQGGWHNTVAPTGTFTVSNNTAKSGLDFGNVTVLPAIQIVKTATPTHVPETGGLVQFEFEITNTSQTLPLTLTVTSIVDDVFGDLLAEAVSQNGGESIVLAPGATYTFYHSATLASDALAAHTNTVTAIGRDQYGRSATDDDDATVTFDDVAPIIRVTKSANPTHVPETGGDVSFTILVENIGPEDVTLTSLTDDVFGDLDGQGDCVLPVEIPIGGSVSFHVTKRLASDSLTPHTDVVTGIAVDDDGTQATDDDDATVTFDDVAPIIRVTKTATPGHIPEGGDYVVFTFLIENVGPEDVVLTSLVDSVFGDLDGQGDVVLPTPIPIGGSVTFHVTKALSSDDLTPHYNVVTATAVDDDGTQAIDDDDETVTFDDTPPEILVTKTAVPNYVPETGGDVTFTITVRNIGGEAVTLTGAVDTVFGPIDVSAFDKTYLLVGETATCSFTEFLASDDLTPHYDVVTVTAEDNDGTPASDDDDETVTFDDVAPEIRVTKTADPTHVPETGGDVEFTFLVENMGPEDVTLTSLVDDVFGDLDGQGDCVLPVEIPIGGSVTFHVTKHLSSDDLVDHYDVVTATAYDDDQTPATDDDDETVTFDDVAPEIQVAKTASPTSVPETGGDVTFTVTVENVGTEAVTLTGAVDTVFGPIDVSAFDKTYLLVGETATYSFTEFLASDDLVPHYDVVTVAAEDNDGTPVTDDDDETVTFEDVAPEIRVTKTAEPTSIPETGANVTFTFLVENIGPEDVTLTSLVDDVFGDLNGQGDCVLPVEIPIGESVTFHVTKWLAADDLAPHTDIVTATAVDDDETPATDDDDETVTFEDVAPEIRVTKTAEPTSIPETGANVTFTFLVENIGQEDVTLTSLVDSVFGNLNGQGDCLLPVEIPIGGSVSFRVTKWLSSEDLEPHYNVTTATAVDDDETPATDEDDATVIFEEVPVDLAITKVADKDEADPGEIVTYTLTYWNRSEKAARDFTIVDDFDERYVTVVDRADGVVADGKITWTIPGPLAAADGPKTIIYKVRIISDMPTGTTNVDNVVVVTHPDDDNPSDNTAKERVVVVVPEEPFLPFTGGEYALLLSAALVATILGLLLRLRSDRAA